MKYSYIVVTLFFLSACQSFGQLTILGDINNSLKEVSAAEFSAKKNLIWVIEDSGNKNNLYGLDFNGTILHDIDIENCKNQDWEDLTQDKEGNVYIGDFGNNNKKRDDYKILKIYEKDLDKESAKAEIIEFKLAKKEKAADFESFFILNENFYLFSKNDKKVRVFRVPNKIGKHKAVLTEEHRLEGKNTKITSAAIDKTEKVVVLLNHDKLWKLSNFKEGKFFNGTIEAMPFYHNSQKEGVGFLDKNILIITDERNGSEGGNVYSFDLTRS